MMTLKSNKTGQAEYDRFLDLMAKLYLKYGDKYRLVSIFNDTDKTAYCRKGTTRFSN